MQLIWMDKSYKKKENEANVEVSSQSVFLYDFG